MTEEIKQERQTKEITTPSGHKVLLKAELKNREVQQILSSITEPVKVDETGKTVSSMKGNVELQNGIAMACIISIDDEKNGVLNKLLDMYVKDSRPINDECMKIFNDSYSSEAVSAQKKESAESLPQSAA